MSLMLEALDRRQQENTEPPPAAAPASPPSYGPAPVPQDAQATSTVEPFGQAAEPSPATESPGAVAPASARLGRFKHLFWLLLAALGAAGITLGAAYWRENAQRQHRSQNPAPPAQGLAAPDLAAPGAAGATAAPGATGADPTQAAAAAPASPALSGAPLAGPGGSAIGSVAKAGTGAATPNQAQTKPTPQPTQAAQASKASSAAPASGSKPDLAAKPAAAPAPPKAPEARSRSSGTAAADSAAASGAVAGGGSKAPRQGNTQVPGERLRLNSPALADSASQAWALADSGQPDAALAQYRRVLQRHPDDVEALAGAGALLQRRGEREAAMAMYRRALSVRPDHATVQSNLLQLQSEADPAQAESRLKELSSSAQADDSAHASLGHVLARQGRWAEAQQAYFQAYTLRPNYAAHAYNLAVALDRLHQRRQALTYYRTAVGLPQTGDVPLAAAHARIERLRALEAPPEAEAAPAAKSAAAPRNEARPPQPEVPNRHLDAAP